MEQNIESLNEQFGQFTENLTKFNEKRKFIEKRKFYF